MTQKETEQRGDDEDEDEDEESELSEDESEEEEEVNVPHLHNTLRYTISKVFSRVVDITH